jgi:hypothetical protein
VLLGTAAVLRSSYGCATDVLAQCQLWAWPAVGEQTGETGGVNVAELLHLPTDDGAGRWSHVWVLVHVMRWG